MNTPESCLSFASSSSHNLRSSFCTLCFLIPFKTFESASTYNVKFGFHDKTGDVTRTIIIIIVYSAGNEYANKMF